jgi:hypothetical protein
MQRDSRGRKRPQEISMSVSSQVYGQSVPLDVSRSTQSQQDSRPLASQESCHMESRSTPNSTDHFSCPAFTPPSCAPVLQGRDAALVLCPGPSWPGTARHFAGNGKPKAHITQVESSASLAASHAADSETPNTVSRAAAHRELAQPTGRFPREKHPRTEVAGRRPN